MPPHLRRHGTPRCRRSVAAPPPRHAAGASDAAAPPMCSDATAPPLGLHVTGHGADSRRMAAWRRAELELLGVPCVAADWCRCGDAPAHAAAVVLLATSVTASSTCSRSSARSWSGGPWSRPSERGAPRRTWRSRSTGIGGREKELLDLESMLRGGARAHDKAAGKRPMHPSVASVGSGPCWTAWSASPARPALGLEFTHRHRHEYKKVLCWVHGEARYLRQSYLKLPDHLGIAVGDSFLLQSTGWRAAARSLHDIE